MPESCYSQYKACVKKCQPANGPDHCLCIADCALEFLNCFIPRLPTASADELIEFNEVLEQHQACIEELHFIATAMVNAKLSQQIVVKPGGKTEPFLPNSKLYQRLRVSGIDQQTTNTVTREVAKEFKDGQSSEQIRQMVLNKLEVAGPGLSQQFLGIVTT
ncbi:MAG: hypothetical protein AB2551_12640 [Candidatus Thiodiazotropha sp.]